MSNAPAPKISRAPRVALVWFVPIIALAVAGWMLYREWRSHGPEITIEFADGSGVEANKTVLEHKGVAVGTVKSVALKNDLSGVILRLRLDQSAAALAHSGAQFWLVHPEIGFSGVRGLETLVTGVRLNVRPGEGPLASSFRGLDKPPAAENKEEGRAFVLRSDRLGALLPHAPVSYREVKVGEVEASRLADDSTAVLIRVRVYTPYVDLVRTNSQFWNAGGVPLKISLFGTEIKNSSIESLLTGAIAFATPTELAPPAAEGAEFKLNNDTEKEWAKWQPKIPIKAVDEAREAPPRAESLPSMLKPKQ
jgi:paraquat-inducible protein B